MQKENNSFLSWLTPLRLLIILGVFFTGWLIYYLRWTLMPFWLALFLAYAVNPLIEKAGQKHLGRRSATFIFIFAVVLFFSLVISLIIPQIFSEIKNASDKWSEYVQKVQGKGPIQIESFINYINSKLGTNFSLHIDELMEIARDEITSLLGKATGLVSGGMKTAIQSTVGLFQFLLNVLIFFFFLAFCLLDFPKIKQTALSLIPPRYQESAINLATKTNDTLSRFLRGQIIVSIILMVGYSVSLTLIRVDMALGLGVLSGLLFLVPYVGIAIAVTITLLITLLNLTSWWQLLGVLIIYCIWPALETLVLTPKITGSKLTLSPMMVILSILIFSALFGIIGLLVALPVTAVLKIVITDLAALYKKSDYYLGKNITTLSSEDFPEESL